ncbi:DUF3087 family protein [Aidingimonas lacisalsi]|uniref:DUF3087 family protein n=1 Tax=Aidingimonas lacisalsi TaxID=2604086 RepID=UPI0011D28930|nr:DUF3087 family protein [Aidingimonas lacisalsi]
MIFRLESCDAGRYRRKARIISVAMAAQMVVLGIAFSQWLAYAFGTGVWCYLLGMLFGLLATSVIFAVLIERPWLSEMRYAWQLRQRLSQIRGYLPALRQAVDDDNPTALDVLAFYHRGLEQLAVLNGRALDEGADRQAEKAVVQRRREMLGLPPDVDGFDPEDLSAFKKR